MKIFLIKLSQAAIFGVMVGIILLLFGRTEFTNLAFAETTTTDTQQIVNPVTMSILKLMTKEEIEKCGIIKLSPTEQDELNKWLTSYSLHIVTILNSSQNITSTTIDFKNIEGASLIAQNGKMLGVISKNKYTDKSISNKYSDYGSKYNTDSILNKYGEYGSDYSDISPFNKYASKPPLIILNGKIVAYLTKNSTLSPRVDPLLLLAWLEVER